MSPPKSEMPFSLPEGNRFPLMAIQRYCNIQTRRGSLRTIASNIKDLICSWGRWTIYWRPKSTIHFYWSKAPYSRIFYRILISSFLRDAEVRWKWQGHWRKLVSERFCGCWVDPGLFSGLPPTSLSCLSVPTPCFEDKLLVVTFNLISDQTHTYSYITAYCT